MSKLEQVTAINAKHQTAINKHLEWDKKYNDEVDRLDGEESRRTEHCFERACEEWEKLPKREQKQITKKTGFKF